MQLTTYTVTPAVNQIISYLTSIFVSAAPSIQIYLLGQCSKSNKDVAHLTAQKRTSLCSWRTKWKTPIECQKVPLTQNVFSKSTKPYGQTRVWLSSKWVIPLENFSAEASPNPPKQFWVHPDTQKNYQGKETTKLQKWREAKEYYTLYATARELVASWTVRRRNWVSDLRASKSRIAISILFLTIKPSMIFMLRSTDKVLHITTTIPENLRHALRKQSNCLKCKGLGIPGNSICIIAVTKILTKFSAVIYTVNKYDNNSGVQCIINTWFCSWKAIKWLQNSS